MADGVWKGGGEEKRLMIIVATRSLPAVDIPNADRGNAVRSCQLQKNSHYVLDFKY